RWIGEYQRVREDWRSLHAQEQSLQVLEDLRLLVVRAPEPMHYYALFGESRTADMVLSMYPGQRYELEYKYTTWVDTTRQAAFARVPLQPLADRLNKLEPSATWEADRVRDTGPGLRIKGEALSKAERFAHPYERSIRASDIPQKQLLQTITQYYREAYQLA
ncbi:MAG: DUF6687 family protein, partial [Bacteroidota bacterium]